MCTQIKCSMWKEQTPTTPPAPCKNQAAFSTYLQPEVFPFYIFSWFLRNPFMCLIQSFQHLSLHWHTVIHPNHGHPVLWGSANLRLTGLHAWHTSNRLSDCWYNRGCVHVCGPAHQCCRGRGHSSNYRWHHQWCRGRGRHQRWLSRQLCDPRGLHAGQQQRRGSWQQSELLTHCPRLSSHREYYRGRGE